MEALYLAERYEVLHKIGSGGGGEVYAVSDKLLKKNLALKIFSPDKNISADDERFFNEYLLNHKLTGKNLVQTYDYGYTGNNFPFYTMDLLPQGNIDEQLHDKDMPTKLECCRQICMALAFLHFLDLIHNDLKPENIKLTDDNGSPRIKLLDLGLAVNFDPESPANRLSGTVEYMAPELFESRNPDRKTDLYSLGVIFYKLILNHLPFSGDDPLLIISDKLEKEAPPIDPGLSQFPPEFIELTQSLLHRDPSRRPESAFEAANVIGHLIGNPQSELDFRDILSSVIGLTMAGKFEKIDVETEGGRNFLFHDELQMRRFIPLLKARLQSRYLEVEIMDNHSLQTTKPSIVSPKAEGIATVKITRLVPGMSISKAGLDEHERTYNILLSCRFGENAVESSCHRIEIDLLPRIENWLCEKNLNQEVIDKIAKISSNDTASLAEILALMQEAEILRFNGRQWDCEPEKFVSFPFPAGLRKKAVDCLEYLPDESKTIIRRLAIMRYEFDRHFVRRYLNGLTDDPDGTLANFAADRILVRRDEYYSFKNEILRVGLVNSISPPELRRLHLRAAGIIETSGGVRPDERVLNLAHNYSHAGELDEAVKWTLKASKALIAQEEYRVVLKMVSNVLEIAEKSSATDTADHVGALLAVRGDIENRLGMNRKSLRTFSSIVRIKRKLSDKTILACAYRHAGDLYKAACQYQKGLKALHKALTIYLELDDKIELSHTYNNIGNIYWIASRIDMALENYGLALKLQEELNLQKELASTLNNMGSCYIIKNQLDKTIEYYKRSIEIKKRINDRPELARTYNNLGAVYHELGNIPEALIYLYNALKINREIDSRRELLFNLDNITACESVLGHFQKAEAYVAEGLQLANELESLQMQAMFTQHKAVILLRTGVFGQAETVLHSARRIVDRITDQNLEFEIQGNFCRLYLAMYTAEPFQAALDNAEKLAQRIEDKKATATVLTLKCRGLMEFENDYENARIINTRALQLARQIKSEYMVCNVLLNDLRVAIETGEPADVNTDEIDSLIAKPVNEMLKPDYLFLLAQQAMKQGVLDRAREFLSEASKQVEIQGDKNLHWKIKYLLGRIERALLNYEESYVSFKQAVMILKSLAQTISNPDYLRSFLGSPASSHLKQEIADLARRMGQK